MLISFAAFGQQAPGYNLGRTPTPDQIRAADITVLPDGTGLPAGQGNAVAGEPIYKSRCAVCHGPGGEGRKGEYPALVGGRGTLATAKPVKTVGSYWPYATTVWDHINRAMPFNTPHVLPVNDVYAVTAWILYLNGIVTRDQQLSDKTLPKVVMPNRNGFVVDSRPDIKAKR
ncbi:MAG: putative cytochrome c region protein [Bryobacterales bacterium]|nr:putative cytochrome c region protein [Bryobacterales bacterium]